MDAFRNPYSPGAGTEPRALTGRDALLRDYEIALRRAFDGRPGKSLMPTGLRGVGKTVLLSRFCAIAEAHAFVVAQIEASENRDFIRRLAARLRGILYELDRGTVSAKVRRALAVLKTFTLTIPGATSISIGVEPLAGSADSGLLDEDLTAVLAAAGEAAQDRRRGLLLAIDEVQYLDAEELGALISAIHRTVQLRLPVLLVGAGLPQLPGLAGDAKSYAERLFDFPEIGRLAADDAREAIARPAQSEDVELEPGALESLVERSHGFPYFLQEWGYHVWNVADGSPISVTDVDRAAARVQAQLDGSFFRVRIDRLTPAEKRYLVAMAELGGGPHRSGDIAMQLGAKVTSVAPLRSGLIRKGMIYSPAHGDTAFTVPMFDEYLRRVRPR